MALCVNNEHILPIIDTQLAGMDGLCQWRTLYYLVRCFFKMRQSSITSAHLDILNFHVRTSNSVTSYTPAKNHERRIDWWRGNSLTRLFVWRLSGKRLTLYCRISLFWKLLLISWRNMVKAILSNEESSNWSLITFESGFQKSSVAAVKALQTLYWFGLPAITESSRKDTEKGKTTSLKKKVERDWYQSVLIAATRRLKITQRQHWCMEAACSLRLNWLYRTTRWCTVFVGPNYDRDTLHLMCSFLFQRCAWDTSQYVSHPFGNAEYHVRKKWSIVGLKRPKMKEELARSTPHQIKRWR